MPSQNKANLILIFATFIASLYAGSVQSDEFNKIFPKAPKFFEEEFWEYHKKSWDYYKFAPLNILASNWVCELSMVEKIKLCVRVLECLKSSSLELSGEPIWNKKQYKCVPRTVALESLSNQKLPASILRCPLKFSLKESDNSYTVGGIDPKSPGFYVTQGISSKSVFVLHDVVEITNTGIVGEITPKLQKNSILEVSGVNAGANRDDSKGVVDQSSADPIVQPYAEREIDRKADVSQRDGQLASKEIHSFEKIEAVNTGVEHQESGSNIKTKDDNSPEIASHEIEDDINIVQVDGELYVSNLLVKVANGPADYKIEVLPDFMKKLSS